MVLRESIYYIHLRQAYLLSPLYANRMSSRTVLYMQVPREYQSEIMLRRMLGDEVKNLWIVDDCSKVHKLVKQRDRVAMKLEEAETKIIKMANKERLKRLKKGSDQEPMQQHDDTNIESRDIAARWVSAKKRPTHRLKLPFGKKVDTIDWCRQELKTLIPKVKAAQDEMQEGEGKSIGAVFVEFYTQLQAQDAFQDLTHHQALHMAPRFIGVNPEEVIWENLRLHWASRVVRNIFTTAIVTFLLIFWAIPVAFVGTLSNIQALTQGDPTANPPKPPLLPWLGFINDIPSEILGVVQGLLPSVLLAALMALLPVFLYWMAKIAGKPTASTVELRVQNSYFVFQVIQVFLVTTISSGAAAAAIKIINDPTKATDLLAEDLPKASNFYISYFILQGLMIAGGAVAQVIDLLIYWTLGWLLDNTPRKKYERFVSLTGLSWGTEFPVYTLLTVICKLC